MAVNDVAIVGAGLAGLSLALFLRQDNIKCTIYELRAPGLTTEGAIMLSPNALRTLDTLGVLDRIRSRGFFFRDLTFQDSEGRLVDKYEMGNADRYGYDALRIYRQIILDELKRMVQEAGVQIIYEKQFSHVVEETDLSVTFAFKDGEQVTADLLVGADGIHSTVRKYLHPTVQPAFSGVMGVTAAAPTAGMKFPKTEYPLPVSISGPAGTFVIAPQDPQISEALVGMQFRTHDRDRQEWDALNRDKAQLLAMLRTNYDLWNPLVQSALDAIPSSTLSLWAVHVMPKLDRWTSPATGRVVILGDAAHAISPAAGQGANQAFEDVHSLARLLTAANAGQVNWMQGVAWWREYRQERMDKVNMLNAQMIRRREPGWSPSTDATGMDGSDILAVRIDQDVAASIAELAK